MRTGTAYVANKAPSVSISFFNIAGSIIGSAYTNASNGRVIHIHKVEEPYTGRAVIHLLNNDDALSSVDLLGSLAYITWSWDTGSGSVDEPIFVVSQKFISQEGKLICELICLNTWEMLEHSRGINVAADSDMEDVAFGGNRIWEADTPVKDIIEEILYATGSFLDQWGLTTSVTIAGEPAGADAIQTYEPYFVSRLNDDDRTLVRRLLQMTESVITWRSGAGATYNYIDPGLPGPYYTYQNDNIEHPFFINIDGASLEIPNHIIYVDQEPNILKGEVANYVGSAEKATFPIGELGRVYTDPSILSDADAQLRAEKHLARLTAETELGELFVPMNCTVELYDEIEIIDSRNGNTSYGRVGQIERTFTAVANGIKGFNSQRESYSCRIKLGGIGGGSTRIESAAGGVNDIDTTISDFKGRSTADPFLDTPQFNGSVISQHLAPVLFRKNATANTTFTTGTLGDLTGATYTFTAKVASVLKITANAYIRATSAPAIADHFRVTLDLDGAAIVGTMSVLAQTVQTTVGQTISRTWLIAISAGSHTIKMQGQRITGTANWIVDGDSNQTDMIGELFSAKNAVGEV